MTNPKLQAFIDKHIGICRDMILDTLHCFESATKDTLLIVEIR